MSKELKEKVRHRLKEHSHIFTNERLDEQELRYAVSRIVEELKIRERLQLDENSGKKIVDELIDEFMGFGPLKALLEDKAVTEIMVNGPKKVYVEKEGKMFLSDVTFENNQHLLYIIQKILMP